MKGKIRAELSFFNSKFLIFILYPYLMITIFFQRCDIYRGFANSSPTFSFYFASTYPLLILYLSSTYPLPFSLHTHDAPTANTPPCSTFAATCRTIYVILAQFHPHPSRKILSRILAVPVSFLSLTRHVNAKFSREFTKYPYSLMFCVRLFVRSTCLVSVRLSLSGRCYEVTRWK